MKKILYLLLVGVLAFTVFSCSEDIMDDINKNVNNPTDVGSHLIITDVMTNTAYSVSGTSFNFYASSYIEHHVGVYGQLNNAEIRVADPTSSTTFNNPWGGAYENLYNLKLIIEKCSKKGTEEGNFHTLGISQILTAYNLSMLTDGMGDIPWSEALQPGTIFTPVLDKQQDIYNEIFALLDNAIVNLGKVTTFEPLGEQDFVYGGNTANWLKFAYGLKARFAMRLSHVSPAYADVITFANSSFTSASEQCEFAFDGSTVVNPNYKFFTDRDYFGASQSLHDKLADRNDPRDDVYFVAHPDAETGDIVFAPNGSPVQTQTYYSISGILQKDAPSLFMSYHELEFLKAEAYVRTNDLVNAETALKNAITAAFTKVNIDLHDTIATNYFDDEVKARFDADPLAEVMIQKYIAFFEDESLEAYNDYRRLTAMGDNVIALSNPLNSSKFPLRYTYGADDVTTNVNVRDAYGDGSYVYTENVWWAGGSR
jgi:hypothetical protein